MTGTNTELIVGLRRESVGTSGSGAVRRLAAIVAVVGLLAAGVGSACSDSDGGEAMDEARLQEIVNAWGERFEMSAMAVSVMSPSGSVTSVGYSSDGQAPDESSRFMIGSVSKTVTAATALLLVEEGVLELDEPIERWLPEFPRADEITLRHLLSHTAGLQDEPEGGFTGPEGLAVIGQVKTPAEMLAQAARTVGDESLPSAHVYSNGGYVVAGSVIEAATGESLGDVMQAQIFDPVGMADSYLGWPDSYDEQLVLGELTLPDGMVIALEPEVLRGITSQDWGGGAVVSTTSDLAKFYGSVTDDLLAPSSIEEMTTAPPGSDGYGLGIERWSLPDGITPWGHLGGREGYTSGAAVDDDRWTVAVLTNFSDVEMLIASESWGADYLIGEVLAEVGAES